MKSHVCVLIPSVLAFGTIFSGVAASEIGTVTEPACNGEVIVVCGEGLDAKATKIKAFCLGTADGGFRSESLEDGARHAAAIDRQPAVPDVPPAGSLDCEVVGGGRGYLQVVMTHDDRQAADAGAHETAPDFFNLIRDCRVSDGGGIVVGAGGRLPQTDQPALPWANFGNRVIGNEILRTVPFSGAQYGSNWRWGGGWSNLLAGINVIPMDLGKQPGTGLDGPPRMLANVIQDNWVGLSAVGVGISVRASDTLVYKNHFHAVRAPIVDRGRQTRQFENVVHDDEEYTPERGPIR